jgi:hypothetical protein
MRRLPAAFAALALLSGPSIFSQTVAAAEEVLLTVFIENVSDETTLKLANGKTGRVPVAPGAYAVVRGGAALFEVRMPAGDNGLEALAEDGNAEPLIAYLQKQGQVREAGMFVPGQPFTVHTTPGNRFVFAAMFVESNDLFYSPDPRGIELFDPEGRVVASDVTTEVKLWDAGTEVNEAPGRGQHQVPRQSGPNTGPAEVGAVRPVNDGFGYPSTADVLRVTLNAE